MKILKMIMIIISVFTSCSSMINLKVNECNENINFKKKLFYNISIAEKYTVERTTVTEHTIKTKTFLKALTFIANYTSVSMDKITNYQIGYPNLETFELDKNQWIKWYDANKCNNLK